MAAAGEAYRSALAPGSKPNISTGLPFYAACAHHINYTYHAMKVYVIVSDSISKTDNSARLQDALGDKIVGVRKGIKPHTPWDEVLEIVRDIRENKANIIVTLGACSVTDGAKLASFALGNNVSSADDLSKLTLIADPKDLKPCSIPIINIPTSLSGGEYTHIATATDTRTNEKSLFMHPSMGADLIIFDPGLTTTTPERVWISSGIRSVDHCVEALSSEDPRSIDNAPAFENGLKLLVPNLLKTKVDLDAEHPRGVCMMGVIEAMQGLQDGVPMGGSHAIGHQLGPLGVVHGETSCVILPAVMRYNYEHGDERVRRFQKTILDVFWGEETVAEVLNRRGLKEETAILGDVIEAVVSELGMPTTLEEVGVGREQLDDLANKCLKGVWLQTNAVPLTTKEQVLEILEMAVGDEKASL